MSHQDDSDQRAAMYFADASCISRNRIALTLGVKRSDVADAIRSERERRRSPGFQESAEDRQRIDAIVDHLLADAARADDEDLAHLENDDMLALLDNE